MKSGIPSNSGTGRASSGARAAGGGSAYSSALG